MTTHQLSPEPVHSTSVRERSTPLARYGRWPRILSVVAVLACLPYLTLKVIWLFGGTVGLNEPSIAHEPVMLVANALTAGMEAVAAVLALGLTRPAGLRWPAWVVLLPMTVGTGLLGGILLAMPPELLMGLFRSAPAAAPEGPIQSWVFTMVYGGFSTLGVCLMAIFAIYVHARWLSTPRWHRRMSETAAAPAGRTAMSVALSVAIVAACLAAAVITAADLGAGGQMLMTAAAGVICAAGLLLGVSRRPVRAGTALALAYAGAAISLSWGLYHAVVLSVPNPLVGAATLPVGEVAIEVTRAVLSVAALALASRIGAEGRTSRPSSLVGA